MLWSINKGNLLTIFLILSCCFLFWSAEAQQRSSPFDVPNSSSADSSSPTSNIAGWNIPGWGILDANRTSTAKQAGGTNKADANGFTLYGKQELSEAENGTTVKSADEPLKDDKSRVHRFESRAALLLKNSSQLFQNGYYFSLIQERNEEELCKKNQFKICYLAVGHGYLYPPTNQSSTKQREPLTVAAYFGFNEDNNFNIAFEDTANQNWKPLLARVAEKVNPLNEPQSKQNCDKKVQIPDLETTASEYTQLVTKNQNFPKVNSLLAQNYHFDLKTQAQDFDQTDCDDSTDIKTEQITKQFQNQVKLGGNALFAYRKIGETKDIPRRSLTKYRQKLKDAKFQTKASIIRDKQKQAELKILQDTGKDPDFTQLDLLKDENGEGPIDFDKYLKGQGNFEQDYKKYTNQQTRLLTIEQPQSLIKQSNGQAQRLLPVIATHTIYQYTKILYSKTILGKKIEVKFYAKCQLIISIFPSKHEIYCFGQIYHTIFSYTNVRTLYSFKKLVATNWSWNNNWGGNWGFHFEVPLPPPVSFITINFYVNVRFQIKLALYSIVKQWWYPLIHEVSAFAQTQLTADATASLKVIAIEGGVFIQGTIVKVSTDPTCTLYYYLKYYHRFIIFWIKWYWKILAFQFEWGFKWRYWFFGWKPWKIIAKWTIFNGIVSKFLIINRLFWIRY